MEERSRSHGMAGALAGEERSSSVLGLIRKETGFREDMYVWS